MQSSSTNVLRTSHAVNWLHCIRRYALFTVIANLVWEFAQLPLYTIWETGTVQEMAFAAVHCSGGDLLIALSTLLIALFVVGDTEWPNRRFKEVMVVAVILGICYTIFSEWLNIEVRQAWAYSDLMPVIPIINAGLSPILQWVVIPIAGLYWASKATN